ncbi:hypothetical protein BTVI_98700 [Pitangus sulphuratus]|nr:hypothetical protein BTVI_98700 [Pitangus sulphuratus]
MAATISGHEQQLLCPPHLASPLQHQARQKICAVMQKRLRESDLFSLKKRQLKGDIINADKYLKEGYQEDGDRFFLEVPTNRTRGNGQELMHRKFYLNMKKNFFTVWVTTYWNRLPREVAESRPLEIFKNHLDVILCNVLSDEQGSQMTHCGAFQPYLFCDLDIH